MAVCRPNPILDDPVSHRLASDHKGNRRASDTVRHRPLSDGGNSSQPADLHRDFHSLVLCLVFLSGLVQSVRAPSQVPVEGYSMDLDPPPGLVGRDIHDRWVHRPGRPQHCVPGEKLLDGCERGREPGEGSFGVLPELEHPNVGGDLRLMEGPIDRRHHDDIGHDVLLRDLTSPTVRHKHKHPLVEVEPHNWLGGLNPLMLGPGAPALSSSLDRGPLRGARRCGGRVRKGLWPGVGLGSRLGEHRSGLPGGGCFLRPVPPRGGLESEPCAGRGASQRCLCSEGERWGGCGRRCVLAGRGVLGVLGTVLEGDESAIVRFQLVYGEL